MNIPTMNSLWRSVSRHSIVAVSSLVLLAACSQSTTGSGTSSPPPAAIATSTQGEGPADGAANSETVAEEYPGLPGADTSTSSRAGSIDVCGLLSPADADAVARERGLDGAQTADTQYTLKAEKQDYGSSYVPTSGCKFAISSGGASGVVEIQVVPADNFSLYSSGEPVPGLGDEAYRGMGTTVVRVGDLMLQAGENSFTDDFAVAMFRKMVPHLT